MASGLTTLGAAAFIGAIVVLIVSQWVESNRWPMLVAWIVLTVLVPVVWLLGGRRGSRLVLVLVSLWLVNGCGALWGFELAREDPRPPRPDAVSLARETLADEITEGRPSLCWHMDEGAARRLGERYGEETGCRNALARARAELGEADADRIRRSLVVTPVSVDEDPATPQEDRKIRVNLGENPLELEWLEFTVRYVESRDRWEYVSTDGAG